MVTETVHCSRIKNGLPRRRDSHDQTLIRLLSDPVEILKCNVGQQKEESMSKVIACITIAAIAMCFLWGGLSYAGWRLCMPEHAKPIASNDMPVESVSIESNSGSIIKGWKLNGIKNKGVVILLHSLRSNRGSMVDRARFLWRNGYSVLLFDFQAHGESEGKKITFGYLESKDVESIYQYCKRAYPGEKIGAIGVSLGGAAIVIRNNGKDHFNAVVLESVYPTLERAAENRVRMKTGPLAPILTPLLLSQMKRRIGITKDSLRPVDKISNLCCPLLFIAGTHDKHTTIAESRMLFDRACMPKEKWEIRAKHEDLYRVDPGDYEKKILAFFGMYLQS